MCSMWLCSDTATHKDKRIKTEPSMWWRWRKCIKQWASQVCSKVTLSVTLLIRATHERAHTHTWSIQCSICQFRSHAPSRQYSSTHFHTQIKCKCLKISHNSEWKRFHSHFQWLELMLQKEKKATVRAYFAQNSHWRTDVHSSRIRVRKWKMDNEWMCSCSPAKIFELEMLSEISSERLFSPVSANLTQVFPLS